jgi:hypothetical protein
MRARRMLKVYPMSSLEKKLDSLIAEQDHIRPEDVTLDYIRKKRDENEDVKYDFSTRYGGFNRRNGRVFTPRQAKDLIRNAYVFLDRFKRAK